MKFKKSVGLLILVTLFLVMGVLIYLFLEHTQAFVYYYREQHQIFLNDQDYIAGLVKPVGGFAVLVAQWLTQYFVLPHAGATITTLLCAFSAIFFYLSFANFVKNYWWFLPLAFLPSVIYSHYLEDITFPYEGLVSIALFAFCLWLFSLLWQKRWLFKVIVGIVLLMLFCYFAAPVSFTLPTLQSKENKDAFTTLLKQIHYADTEEWDKLLQVEGISPSNDVQMNYLNLALSHQGRLLDLFFAYQQKDLGSLVIREANYTDVSVLLSRIYYQIGAIGAAQNQAFSSTVGITYGTPSMVKLLVKTYLINGYYALAEKYIKMLEKTTFYADWATEQRRFLYNDAVVEADPELGYKRRCLAPNDRFTMLYGPFDDMVALLQNNPDNREAAEYLLSMLLLSKDVNSINAFINQFSGKGCLDPVPQRLQEAIAIINERNPAYSLAHGVSEETMKAFEEFRQTYHTLRSQRQDMRTLAPKYGRTFWYHMIR